MRVEDVLIKGANELGIELTSEQVQLFLVYLESLKLWNDKINITAVRDERQIVISHFLDSISISRFVSENSKVLDIGSGGGFPGIPLGIVKPSLEITLLDSLQKKVFFMRDVIRKLGLEKTQAIWGRAEDPGNGILRGHFDFVVSRAVGRIESLLELSVPYLVKGGKVILMRGKKGCEEWNQASKTNPNLRLSDSKKLSLPFESHDRVILIIAHVS